MSVASSLSPSLRRGAIAKSAHVISNPAIPKPTAACTVIRRIRGEERAEK
jgi:hypothetical protein